MSERSGAGETWSSANAREGRKLAADRVVSWLAESMPPPARVAVAGTLAAGFAGRLGQGGWSVEALDPPPRPLTEAAAGAWLATSPDVLVLFEVLDGLDEDERRNLLRALTARRCYVVFRCPLEGLSRLWEMLAGGGAQPMIQPIGLLRWLHANTLLRQRRREIVQVRDWAAQVSELRLEPDFAEPRPSPAPPAR